MQLHVKSDKKQWAIVKQDKIRMILDAKAALGK